MRVCRLCGITRQSVYQREKRAHHLRLKLKPIKKWCLILGVICLGLVRGSSIFLINPRLQEQGIKLGRDTLFNYLRTERLLVRPKRIFTKKTNSRHWMKKHPNLLKDYKPCSPESLLMSDITYVQFDEGVHYLSLVTDAFSQKLWAMS